MTFLQYLCERLMGPSAKPGESYWCCPIHDDSNPSFHTLPHKPEYKDRWQCISCGARGDEADLLKELFPAEDYSWRRVRLDQWRKEYDQEAAARTVPKKSLADVAIHFPLRGQGSESEKLESPGGEFSPEADAAVAELISLAGGDPHDAGTREKLLLVKAALEVCGRHGLHPLTLAGRVGFEEEKARKGAEHMAECGDLDCDWYCCRLARGWTPERIRAELEADKRRRVEERQRNMEAALRSMESFRRRRARPGGNGRPK